MPLAKATPDRHTAAATGLLQRCWAAWRERRYVARRCRELLALAQSLQQGRPALAGPALYRRIVERTLGGNTESVDRVLQHAEENFATWPVSRPLSLRDVVHHLAVLEYFRQHAGTQQMRADDLKRLVDDTIPGDL
jgi:hypothetical protein